MCRYQREEAKIQAWVNLQSAKAEAQSRKLEVLLSSFFSFPWWALIPAGFCSLTNYWFCMAMEMQLHKHEIYTLFFIQTLFISLNRHDLAINIEDYQSFDFNSYCTFDVMSSNTLV